MTVSEKGLTWPLPLDLVYTGLTKSQAPPSMPMKTSAPVNEISATADVFALTSNCLVPLLFFVLQSPWITVCSLSVYRRQGGWVGGSGHGPPFAGLNALQIS